MSISLTVDIQPFKQFLCFFAVALGVQSLCDWLIAGGW
jgi:hypothetical protein